MEYESVEVLHVKDENSASNGVTESSRTKIDVIDVSKPVPSSPGNNIQVNIVDRKGDGIVSLGAPLGGMDPSREVNMEASITPDDVMRAGGFGARDDISCFLPLASDSTDFEATIRDARGYEEPQGEIRRPGLGWTEATETE